MYFEFVVKALDDNVFIVGVFVDTPYGRIRYRNDIIYNVPRRSTKTREEKYDMIINNSIKYIPKKYYETQRLN